MNRRGTVPTALRKAAVYWPFRKRFTAFVRHEIPHASRHGRSMDTPCVPNSGASRYAHGSAAGNGASNRRSNQQRLCGRAVWWLKCDGPQSVGECFDLGPRINPRRTPNGGRGKLLSSVRILTPGANAFAEARRTKPAGHWKIAQMTSPLHCCQGATLTLILVLGRKPRSTLQSIKPDYAQP